MIGLFLITIESTMQEKQKEEHIVLREPRKKREGNKDGERWR